MESPVPIIYEDNHLLVVHKPAGLLTQDSGTGCENLEDLLKCYLKQRDMKSGGVYLKLPHRIDFVTSGLVVFAKSKKALSRLLEQMRENRWTKIYYALVERCLPDREGVLEHYLVHLNKKAMVSDDHPMSKKCRLSYRFLKELGQKFLYEVQLETGRYHQIRAQLSAMNAPICGDSHYGASRRYLPKGIALQHQRLILWHPVQKRELVMEAPLANWALD